MHALDGWVREVRDCGTSHMGQQRLGIFADIDRLFGIENDLTYR